MKRTLIGAVLLLLEDLVGAAAPRPAARGGWRSRRRRAGRRRRSSGRMSSTQRRTFAWPIRSCTCLSNSVQHRHRVGHAAVDPDQRDRAAAAHQRRSPGRAPRAGRRRPSASPSRRPRRAAAPAILCASLPTGEPCASMPTASITASGPRPSVSSRTASPTSSSCSSRSSDLDAVRSRARSSRSGTRSIADHRSTPRCSAIRGGHVADRAEAEHRERAALAGSSAYSTACHAVGSTSER